jgi:hypothetical protein
LPGEEELVEKIIHRCVGRTAAIKASINGRQENEQILQNRRQNRLANFS